MRVLALILFVSTTSCFSFGYHRRLTHEPVESASVDALVPGQSGLGDALHALGAPIYVWEGRGGDTLVAYGAQRDHRFGFRISVPVFARASASVSVENENETLRGYVLVFDESLKLKLVRAGLLRNLGVVTKARPSPVEEP